MSAFFMHLGASSCFSVEGKSWDFLWKHSWAMSLTSQGCTEHPKAHPQVLVHLQSKPSVKNNSCRNCTDFCAILSFLVAHILLLTCSPVLLHNWWEASGKSHWNRQIVLIKKTWTRIFRSAVVWASFTIFRVLLPFSFPTAELFSCHCISISNFLSSGLPRELSSTRSHLFLRSQWHFSRIAQSPAIQPLELGTGVYCWASEITSHWITFLKRYVQSKSLPHLVCFFGSCQSVFHLVPPW